MIKINENQSKSAIQGNQKEDAQHGDKCPYKKKLRELKCKDWKQKREIQNE